MSMEPINSVVMATDDHHLKHAWSVHMKVLVTVSHMFIHISQKFHFITYVPVTVENNNNRYMLKQYAYL